MDQKENLIKKLSSQPIELVPFYEDIKNEIIKPTKLSITTQYFMDKWAPRLGPTLAFLVIKLRSHCYYNEITKEKRDWCFPSQEKLANALGVSYKTIERELKKDIAKYFIKREPHYIYNDKLKKKIRTSDKYIITMDDPLIPEDKDSLILMSIERQWIQDTPNKNITLLSSPKPHSAVLVEAKPIENPQHLTDNLSVRSKKSVDNLSPNGQFVRHIYDGQIVRANNVNTNVITNNVNNVAQSAKNVSNDPLVEDMINYLGDRKSLGFYRKIAKTCPAQLVYRALGETKEAALSKRIKTTKGAYFTDLIKRLAIEQGVNLKLKDK